MSHCSCYTEIHLSRIKMKRGLVQHYGVYTNYYIFVAYSKAVRLQLGELILLTGRQLYVVHSIHWTTERSSKSPKIYFVEELSSPAPAWEPWTAVSRTLYYIGDPIPHEEGVRCGLCQVTVATWYRTTLNIRSNSGRLRTEADQPSIDICMWHHLGMGSL